MLVVTLRREDCTGSPHSQLCPIGTPNEVTGLDQKPEIVPAGSWRNIWTCMPCMTG